MSKRNIIIGVGVVVLAIAWYAFRPELLFINLWRMKPRDRLRSINSRTASSHCD